jgi:hypothetical protein
MKTTPILIAMLIMVHAATAQPPTVESSSFRIPIQFTENRGQWHQNILYAALRPAQSAYFTRQGFLYRDDAVPRAISVQQDERPAPSPAITASMQFVRPSRSMRMDVAGRTPTQTRFYRGSDSAAWREDAASYASMRYSSVWPNIDVSFCEHDGVLRRIITVKPGGRMSDVRLVETGAEGGIPGNTFAVAREEACPHRLPLVGKRSGDTVSYSLPGPSVMAGLDIITDFVTFFGGSGFDEVGGVALDDSNNIYIVGRTTSADLPTRNAIQPSIHGPADVFIARMNCDGRTLGFCTYLGGSQYDEVVAGGFDAATGGRSHLCVSAQRKLFVVGSTGSTDFPIRGDVVQKNYWNEERNTQRPSVGFVARLNTDGQLERSTYLGGPGGVQLYAPCTDADGDVYMTGWVLQDSIWFITPGVVQPTIKYRYPSNLASVVLKMNADLSVIRYATYMFAPNGNNSNKQGGYIFLQVDRSKNLVAAGVSPYWTSVPIVNAPMPDPRPYHASGFITKLNPTATQYVYSTIFGSRYYLMSRTYLDENDNLYLTGMTDTAEYIYTKSYLAGERAIYAFLSKYNPAGTLLFSTVIGGGNPTAQDNQGCAITKDRCGNIIMNGFGTPVFPIMNGNPTVTPWIDNILCAFDPGDGELLYSTRTPGIGTDGTTSLLYDKAGNIVAASAIFDSYARYIIPKNAYQDVSRNGGTDGLITRFRLPICQPLVCELRSQDTIRVTKRRRQTTPSRFAITLDLTNHDQSQTLTLAGTLSLPKSVFLDPSTQQRSLSGITLGPGEHRQFQWTAGIDSTQPPGDINAISFDASYAMQAQLSACPLSISVCSITIVVLSVDDDEPVLSCRMAGIDTVKATRDAVANADIPFPLSHTLKNDDEAPVRIDSVRLVLPEGMGVETIPVNDDIRPGAILARNQELQSAWSITVHPRTVPRTATVTVLAYDHYGLIVSTCEKTITIEPVVGTKCTLAGPAVIRCDATTGITDPDTVYAEQLLENTLDTAQIASSVRLDLTRAPHCALAGGESAEQGPVVIAPRFRRHFSWKLVTLPFAAGGSDTLVVRYRMAADSAARSCEIAVPLQIVRYRLACALTVPEQPVARDTIYEHNPCSAICDIANSGQTSSPEGTVVLSCADAALRCIDSAAARVSAIDTGGTQRHIWRLLARTSRYERRSTCTVSVRDSSGVEMTQCATTIVLPPIVSDLRCSLETPDTVHYDLPADTYTPDPFTVALALANVLDTAQSAIETQIDLSAAPHLAPDGGECTDKALDSIPAHDRAAIAWRLAVARRSDSAITERVTVRYRHAGDSAAAGGGWLACAKDIVIEGGKRIISASCSTAGHDTLWADVAYEDVIPHPVQVQYTITNTGTVPLDACTAAIMHPAALMLVNPSDSIQTYGTIPSGASVAREWLLELDQSQAQTGDMQLSWVRGCSNLASDSACTHRVTLLTGAPRGIVLSPWLLRFRAERRAALPVPQAVALWTGGALVMPWQLQPSASWLDAQPSTGSAKQTVSVQPNTTDLPDGGYPATIGVASTAMVAPPRVDVLYEIGTLDATAEPPAVADGAELESPYPNPTRGAASVALTIATAGTVRLALYDIYGRRVATLAEGNYPAGRHVVRTDLSTLPPGVYVCVLTARAACATRRVVVRK